MLQTASLSVPECNGTNHAFPLSYPIQNKRLSPSTGLSICAGFTNIHLNTSSKKILQSITVLFETWQPWQQRVLLSGLIHRFSKTQLKNLNSSIESLCHRDFVAVWKHAYPMHKVKEKKKVHYKLLPDEVFSRSRKNAFAKDRTDSEKPGDKQDNSKKNKRLSAENKKRFLTRQLNYRETRPNFAAVGGISPSRPKSRSMKSPSLKSPKACDGIKNSLTLDSLSLTHKHLSKQTSLVSLPSVWEMGDNTEDGSETEFDFQSRVTLVNRPAGDYFPSVSGHIQAGKFVTTSSKCELEQYMTRYDVGHNKTPWPTANQLYKHEKFWSSQRRIVDTNAIRLKELFRNQIARIWKLLHGWEEHRRVRLLLHLLSLSSIPEQRFVADCIKQKIEELRKQESLAANLPQKIWLKVIDYLEQRDVEAAEMACKTWLCILSNEDVWMAKCKEVGWNMKIPDMVNLIQRSCSDAEVPDWRQIYFTLRQFVGRFGVEVSESVEELSRDLAKQLQSAKGADNEADSESSSEKSEKHPEQEEEEEGVKVILYEGKESYFSSLKMELEAKRFEELERARKMREEEERKRKEAETRRLKLLKKKRMEQIEKVMLAVKPIVSDIQEKDLKKRKAILTQKTFVKVFDTLLSEDELKSAAKSIGLFAIDHLEEDTQSTKPWLTDNYVRRVGTVLALQGHVRPVCSVLAHGARVISAGMDRKIRFWTHSGDCYATIEECVKGGIRSMVIGTDERCRTLYAASWDRTISVIDSVTFKRTGVLIGHEDTVSGLAIDANYLVSCSYDATIRVYNVENNELLHVLHRHDNAILCLALRDGIIVTGGVDKILNVTDAKSGELLKVLVGHNHPVTALKMRKNLIVSGDRSGYLCFWSLGGSVEPVREIQAHQKRINAIEFSDQRMFTASDDKQVKEWNLFTLRCLRTMQGHSQGVLDVKFAKEFLLTCSRDGTVRMWWWLKKKNDEEKKEDTAA